MADLVVEAAALAAAVRVVDLAVAAAPVAARVGAAVQAAQGVNCEIRTSEAFHDGTPPVVWLGEPMRYRGIGRTLGILIVAAGLAGCSSVEQKKADLKTKGIEIEGGKAMKVFRF